MDEYWPAQLEMNIRIPKWKKSVKFQGPKEQNAQQALKRKGGNNKSRKENRTKIKYKAVGKKKRGKGIKISKGEESQVHI